MGTSLFVTIAIMTVIVAITAGLFARGRNTRTLVAGIGFALLPLGLLLTGMSDLLVSGIESLISWVNRTGWTNTMSWGAGLGGLGILLIVVARFLPEPKPGQGQDAAPREQKSVPSQPAGQPAPGPAPKAGKPSAGKGASGEEDLDEIEAILKKRGIV